jgi:hypothetical protein
MMTRRAINGYIFLWHRTMPVMGYSGRLDR